MARPQDKASLIKLATENYERLMSMIESLTAEQQVGEFPFEDRDRNIRDVLIHLYEWHRLMSTWYKVGMGGAKPAMPKEGYTWRTTAAMNLEFWQDHQQTSLAESKTLVAETHQEMLKLIESHTDEELFTKKYYPWTGSTSLGAYLVSATSSHYDWALKKVRKYIKSLK